MRHETHAAKEFNLSGNSFCPNVYGRLLWLLLVVICAATLRCEAQDYSLQTGSPTFSVNQPVPYGFANLANGNVHVEIPLASAPQRGRLAFAAKLVYDSRIWQIVHAGGSLVWKPSNLPLSINGWRFVTNATPGTVTFDATQITKGCNDIDNPTVVNFVDFVWMSPDGTPRKFPVATAQDPGCPDDVSSADGYAVDSSGYHMYVTNYSTVIVYAKDGTQVYPRVEDANGNYFTTDANGNVIDTLGRTVVQQSTSGNQTFYDVLNSQGKTSRITVTTKQILVRTLFLQPGVSEDQETITVLDKVSLPNGEAYTFGYDEEIIVDPATGAFQPGYGLLTGVSPGGGYTYQNFVDPFGIVNRWAASTIDSSIKYLANPGSIQATLSRNGGTEAFGFTLNNGAWLTTATTRIGDHQVQQITNTYDFTQTCPNPFINVILNPCVGPAYIRLLKSVTSNDAGFKQTTYGYDDPRFGNLNLIQDWNYFPPFGTPAIPDRKTIITMHPVIGQNILDRVQSVVMTDGAGNPLSQTNYGYDGAALTTPTHAIVNHDTSVGTTRGNLTQVSRWAGGTTFWNTNFTYDTAGQVLSVKDAVGNLTTLDYTDNFFNDAGAGQTFGAPNANPSMAADAYPTTVTLPIGKVTLGYYYGSGKQAFAIDQNGQQTAQHFTDPLDRLSHTVGPKGWVQIAYDSLFSYDIFTGLNDGQPSTSCTSCIHLTNFLDLQGRVTSSTVASDPDGATTSTALYDIMGNTLTASNPTRSGIGASTNNSYDVLYRLTKSQNPDNSVAQVFYGNDVIGAGGTASQLCPSATYGIGFPIFGINEVGLKSQVWVDGFGRTIESDEPDAANALSIATCHQYNLAGEITQVAQGSLTRSYHYDPLWRVTQVTTPEAGTETFSYVNDDGTFCSGDPSNACKRIDARGITTRYQYDVLNRLTKTTYSDGTPSAVFNYDEPSALGVTLTNTAGRPSSIYTKDATGNILTGEIFSYDPSGSIINNSQCTPQNCGTGVFQNTYTTDQMGNTVAFNNSWGRSVGAKLNNAGQVTTITVGGSDATHPGTLLSDAKYNAMGEMISSTLGNGLNQKMGYSTSRGWLNSTTVDGGSTGQAAANAATPGTAAISVAGSVQQVSTAAKPGASTIFFVGGSERQLSSSTQSAAPGVGTLIINGTEQMKALINVPSVAGTGTLTLNGAAQSKQVTVTAGTPAVGSITVNGTQQSKVVTVQPAASGTDTLTINGTLQSKQVTQPAASGAGSFTMGGALQTKAAIAATGATGSVTFSGTEQSKAGTPAKSGSVTLTIAGVEASTVIDPCADQGAEPTFGGGGGFSSCPHTVWDIGSVSATVNGFTKSVPYNQGSTPTTIASGIANAFNTDSGSPVTATASGAGVTLTSTAAGATTNYSFTATSSTGDAADFGGPSFTVSPAAGTLANGADAGPQTFDSGNCSVSVNGTPYSIGFGQGDTTNTIASRLASAIGAGTLANGTATGSTISLNTKQTGVASNYSLSSTCSFNSSGFASASFTTTASGASLAGGVNATPAVTDSGTVTVKIGSTFTATACYGPSGSCAALSGCPTGDSTSAQLACFLVSPGNTSGLNRAGSPVSASVAAGSSAISVQAAASGTSTNYSLSNSSTFNTASFSAASFSASPSGPTMTGGKDAVTNTVYDAGTTSAIIGGHTTSYAWSGSTTSPTAIASGLATAINADSAALVSATVTANSVRLTAKQSGTASNYSAQTSTTFDTANFATASFTAGLLTATLTGGADAVTNTVYDSGAITVTVNGHPDSVNWSGSAATGAGVASSLVASINADNAAAVTASVPSGGTVITLTSKTVGTAADYPLSSSITYDSADFTVPAFTVTSPTNALTGGVNPVTQTVYDSGTVKVSVGGYTASAPYGQFWSNQNLTDLLPIQLGSASSDGMVGFALPDPNSPDRVFYLNFQSHVHEASTAPGGNWQDQDITSLSGASAWGAIGTGFAWPNSSSPEHLFSSGEFGGVVELWSDSSGGWHNRNITSLAAGPACGFHMSSFASPDPSAPEHVFCEDNSLHVHELWSDSAGGWHDQDITALSGAPVASGFNLPYATLSSFYWPNSSSPKHVFFVTGPTTLPAGSLPTGDIHELWSDSAGGWHDRDITVLSGAPVGFGPAVTFLGSGSASPEHVFYSTTDGHIHELSSDSSGSWHHQDITSLSGAPAASVGTAGLNGFLSSDPNAPEHVFFTDSNVGDNRELWSDPTGSWHQRDITVISGAPSGAVTTAFADLYGEHVFVVPPNVGSGRVYHLYFDVLAARQVAAALVNDPKTGLNNPDSPVRATLSGTTITLTAAEGGRNSNLPLSASSTFDTTNFTTPSFTTQSGAALTGGQDAVTTPLSDSGTLSVTINNHADSVGWGQEATAQGLASSLANAINLDAGASVTAIANGNLITLTSKASGANTNYTFSPHLTFDSADFGQASFTVQPNSTALQGGRDPNGAVWDTGTITITINGFTKVFPYGATTQTVFPFDPLYQAIPDAFNKDPNSPVWATADGSGQSATFTAKNSGASSNYPISAVSVTNNPAFTGTSFPITLSGSTLTGGTDAGGQATVHDSGAVSLSIGSFVASVEYGQAGEGGIPRSGSAIVCCTAADIASALASVINQSSSAPVIAGMSGSQLFLSAKAGGRLTNYAFSTTSHSGNPAVFPAPSFSFSTASGSLTGGADAPSTTNPTSGTAAIAFGGGGTWLVPPNCGAYYQLVINGQFYKTCLNDSPIDPVSVAALVARNVNEGNSFPAKATASGSLVYLQSSSAGGNTNYIVNSSIVGASPLLSATVSGPSLGGGSGNPTDGTIYALDVGTDGSGTTFSANDSVNGNWSYFYDHLNRIEQASTPTVGYTYDYDIYGNRLHQTPLNGGNALSLVYVNNQIAATGVSYDASGNMTSDGNHTYSYDAEHRLVSVDNGQTATYTYNADGRRIRSTANGTSVDFVYDLGGQAVGVVRPDGSLIRQEIGGLATYSDAAYFHHRDWLGNLRVVTDQTGSIRQTCTNLPYGDGLTCSAAGVTPTHFTSYTRDSETNLDFANVRYYTSQYGRFMSVDPLGGRVSNPQSLNPYAYVGNGPLSATDSSGMSSDCPGDWCVLGPGFVGMNLIANTRSFQSGGGNGWSFGSFFLHLGGLAGIGSDHMGGVPGFSGIGLCGIISGCGDKFGDSGPPKPSGKILAQEKEFNEAFGAVGKDLIAMSGQLAMVGIPTAPPIVQDIKRLVMRPWQINGWFPASRIPVGWAPSLTLDPISGNICGTPLAGGVGKKQGGITFGPLFGDVEHAPEILSGGSVSLQHQRFPLLGGIYTTDFKHGSLYGPTFGDTGTSFVTGYGFCRKFF